MYPNIRTKNARPVPVKTKSIFVLPSNVGQRIEELNMDSNRI